jgi:pilus assembly protein FimV
MDGLFGVHQESFRDMLRKSAAILALFLSFFVSHAFALGLGAVSVESALNQPLRVRIAVLQLGETRLDDVRIQVAAPEDFIRFGIERAAFLNNIRFQTEATASGNFVVLTTNQIVREPYLSFILETRWSNGRLLSEHTILLDLPVFQEPATSMPAPVRAPISSVLTPPSPSSSASTPRQQSQSQASQSSQSVQPVLEPEVISTPNASPEESVPAEPAVTADADAAPSASPAPLSQTQEDTSAQEEAMTEEVVEEVADADGNESEPEPEPETEPETELDPIETEDPATDQAEEPAPEEVEQTITTSNSETLSDIALRVRPNSNVSVQQTMLAIQELNPDAFIGGNINRLRSGQVMRVPSLADIQAIDQRQAIDEVSRQNREIAQADVQPLAAPANTVPSQDTATGQLSVITGDDDSDAPSSAGTNELDRRITELETQLALREEEADRARLEKAEMESRLAELDAQIAAAQEIIRLQDLQLAQLQQSLADAAAEAELAAQQAAAAAQAEVPAPAVTQQPSLLDTLLSNTMLLIAGAGVVVLGLVMLLLRRNKSNDPTDDDLNDINDESFSSVTDKQQPDTDQKESGREFDDYDDAELDSELDDIISVGAEQENKAPALDTDLELDPANIDDICAQADILVEQNNLAQAENLLRAATEENPDNQKLALKLLAVMAVKGDVSAFEMLADEMHILRDPSLDKEVNELRSGLTVDSPEADFVPSKAEQSSQQEKEDTASFLDDLGIDLDDFDEDSFELSDEPEPEPTKRASKPSVSLDELPDSEPDDMDLTFDFADDPSDVETGEKGGAEPEQASDDLGADAGEKEAPAAATDSQDDGDDSIETFSFDEDDTDEEPALAAGSSKDVDDLEIDGLDFDSPTDAEDNQEQPAAEEDLDLETFAFEAPAPEDSSEDEVEAEPELHIADENSLDFDFDKSELEPASVDTEIETQLDDELETFDFDLDTPSTDTVVETPNSDEISFDLDEESEPEDVSASDQTSSEPELDEATVIETQPSSNDFDFDLSELEIGEDEVEQDSEISLSDDDFLDLGDDEEPLELSTEPDDEEDAIEFDIDNELAATSPAEADSDTSTDEAELDFLADDDEQVDVSSISIDDDDDDTYAMSDEDETATKLELAYAYQKMGDSEGAKEILLEVIREGTESQVKEAGDLMKTIETSGE